LKTSFIQKFPSFIKSNRILSLPFYPYAFEGFDFRSYDTVLSVTSSFAKSVITHPSTEHICILLTPTRWLWSQIPAFLIQPFIHYLKKWDYVAAQRPDQIISISQTVADRCLKYYGRESTVVYPPFDEEYWGGIASKIQKSKILKQVQNDNGEYFLVVSRLEPYKKVDLVIRAFASMPNKHLIIIGNGTQSSSLKSMAASNITFIQDATDIELAQYYLNAQALIMPQEEDFGYVSLEAQYFGCPVISFNKGGARETITSGTTGTFFATQSARAIRYAVAHFKRDKYNLKDRRSFLSQFSKETFINTMNTII
jgi:glycosyltransferase involved in cell wall biosynthesis